MYSNARFVFTSVYNEFPVSKNVNDTIIFLFILDTL